MATQNEKLARALEALKSVERDGIVRSSELSRTYKDRLLEAGFLEAVINGWLIVSNPAVAGTSWYGFFWSFISQYLESRFGDAYILSPEASIKRHVGSTLIPMQVLVSVHEAIAQIINLPFDTSIVIHPTLDDFPPNRVNIDGVWIMDLPTALIRISPSFFQSSHEDAEIALRMIRDPSDLLRGLLERSNVVVAGRLVGAYRFLNDNRTAEQIRDGMESAGNIVRVSNPFVRGEPVLNGITRITSPSVARIQVLWTAMRTDVIEVFKAYKTRVIDPEAYLIETEERYSSDAYNSLSIEGYRVTPELVERVRVGNWIPDNSESDGQERNALAARGYYQAFQAVKQSIARILDGHKSAEVIEQDFQSWYREMFSPAVVAGILQAKQLAGYRNNPVYLRGSRYVPPAATTVADCMDMFFELLKAEEEPIVRAILGHFIFVYIHPFPDGNGRIARFIMNAAFASGGYPWTVIRQERRDEYLTALEDASTNHNIRPFARFVLQETGQLDTIQH